MHEPMTVLARADVFVITRSERPRPGLDRELRKYNAGAPIFFSRVKAEYWVEGATGLRLDLRHAALVNAAAFCGLANRGSISASQSTNCLIPPLRRALPHHTPSYNGPIARLPIRYRSLVITEYDAIYL